MEAFVLYLTALVVICTSLYLFFSKKKDPKGIKLPPGTTGWPILGENLKFGLSGPQKFIQSKMKKYPSEVFQTSILGERMAVFLGPAANKFLFSNEYKLLTSWWPVSLRKPLLFPSFVDFSVNEVKPLKNFLYEALKPDQLKQYIPLMDSMARKHLETEWSPSKEVKVFPMSKKYTFALACRLFMNVEDPEYVNRLASTFGKVIEGLFSTPIDFPGTAYYRAVKGGKLVREELLKIIRKRKDELLRSKETAGRDLLSRLLLETDANVELIDEVISNNIVGLLVASYDTTSTALTFALKHLAELPHIYEKVYEEQMEIAKTKGPDDLLNWDDIQKMKYSWNVVCESLRMVPPVPGAFREAISDFTFGGFTIPKGWKTHWTAHSTHSNPNYFPKPEVFDPSRFEGTGPKPYTFVPFGGGPRMCPGKEYARLELLVFMYNVVTRFRMEKSIPNEKITNHASPVPVNGLPVKLQPHTF